MITVRLVNEAPTQAVHRNDPRLGAINKMRKYTSRTISSGDPGDRYPGRGIRQFGGYPGADRFTQSQPIPGVCFRRRADMLMSGRRMRKQLGTTFDVMRKATGSQNNTLAGEQSLITISARYPISARY